MGTPDNLTQTNLLPECYYRFFRTLEESANENFYRRGAGLILSHDNTLSDRFVGHVFGLKSMTINANVTDTCSLTKVEQRYGALHPNDSTLKIGDDSNFEAVYSLLLPPYAAISSLEVEYEGKLLVATIKEKETAANEYNDAIASGNSAFLASKSQSGQFQVSLGNIDIRSSVVVRFTVMSDVGYHMNYLQFCLHRFWFPLGHYPVKITIDLKLKSNFDKFEVSNYQYKITKTTDSLNNIITIESEDGLPKNIMVMVRLLESDAPQSFVETSPADPNQYAVALSFKPKLDCDSLKVRQKAEFIFVVDCSGSMEGTRIALTRRVLHFLVRSLPFSSVKFNIIRFGSNFNKMFPQSKIYDDDSVSDSAMYIDNKVHADLGGTELYQPLKSILSQKHDAEYPRQIIVLTDGGVSGKGHLIDFVRKEDSTSRIFTVGIGNGADQDLVRSLAEAGGGECRMVMENSEFFESEVLELLSISLRPRISNLTMNWPNKSEVKVIQAPRNIRPIYHNERMVVYGLITLLKPEDSMKSYTVSLQGTSPTGQTLTYPIELDLQNTDGTGLMLHTAAATMYIASLEYEESKITKDNSKPHKKTITELALKYNLVSNYTSFVVSADRDQPNYETLKQVNILNNFGELYPRQGVKLGSSVLVSADRYQSQASSGCCSGGSYTPPPPPPTKSSFFNFFNNNNNNNNSTTQTSSTTTTQTSTSQSSKHKELLLSIIKLQNANGSWSVTSDTKKYLTVQCPLKEIDSQDELWLTVLIIAMLEKDFPSMKAIYSNSILKSKQWINDQLPPNITLEKLLETAQSLTKQSNP
ncbi:type A von Willebrand factor domain-containing protein [Heterostelium album PN500]|uniref:Type A von Willebrand factor domain-containing protein n=1 Tax=Heterostelium pallidum (strain ATCC 26659 / Pp 5 / PN500) TaxID=670386 RepID=D3BGR3_HETP5|nr:type A von Willebrand factor domain-containing protein [Heterostelium album PN500]EFA79297.1 type A von Willebrand factor domain-containing protein [Heterostelium album PN500]|eukprot:XP_020431418.1 type A von Willebrand factor domain-containing protein [Heterostelium album PN500]